jgi:hypothetical protein
LDTLSAEVKQNIKTRKAGILAGNSRQENILFIF